MSKSKLGWLMLSGASLAAMGALSSTAHAQEASDEIIVTATGRTAALQDVPVAVSAIPAQQIENTGAHDLRDLTQLAPSFAMGTGQSNSSGTTAYVRGIGTGSDNPGFEGAVGIFVDGVYRARAGAALADLPELERVEVLRGPQGTLFGRNTSAGAISVVTAGPDFAPGMALEAGYGFDDLNQSNMRAMVNVPVGDRLAFRVDGSLRAQDGYVHDVTSGNDINTTDRSSVRGQALWDINDDASLRVIVDHAETDEVCCGVTPVVYGPAQRALNVLATGNPAYASQPANTVTAATIPVNIEDRSMTVTPGRQYGDVTGEDGISAQLDWNLGFATLTSITADRRWRATRSQDVDFNLIDIAYRNGVKVGFDNLTQELRLQGQTGALNWLVGAFYSNEDMHYRDAIQIGAQENQFANAIATGLLPLNGYAAAVYYGGALNPFALPSVFGSLTANPAFNGLYLSPNANGSGQQSDQWRVETESYALFTHDQYNVTDDLVLTIGARYNHETKDLTADLSATSASCTALQGVQNTYGLVSAIQGASAAGATLMNLACNPAVNPIANGSWNGSEDENEVTGTASLAYHFDPSTMAYASYARGYKSGGYNVDRSGFLITPATTSVGSCGVAAPTGRVCVDDLHFKPEFTDSYEIGFRSSPFGRNSTFNITGFLEQIHDYQLNAFNGFNFITRNIPEVVTQGVEIETSLRPFQGFTVGGGVTYADAHFDSTVVFNPLNPGPNTVNSGDPLANAPQWVVTGQASYLMPIGADMHALFYIDGRWNDGYRTQTLNREPNGLTDNDAYAIFDGRVALGPNTDHWSVEIWGRNLFDETYLVGAFQLPLQDGTYAAYPNQPRTYGVTVKARF